MRHFFLAACILVVTRAEAASPIDVGKFHGQVPARGAGENAAPPLAAAGDKRLRSDRQ